MSYAYFHRDGKGAWHGYDAKTNAAIEAARPLEATLTLSYPDNPEKYRTFEIRFGAKAVSRRLKSPPTSGIIQVNVADENTRVVERRARRPALADPLRLVLVDEGLEVEAVRRVERPEAREVAGLEDDLRACAESTLGSSRPNVEPLSSSIASKSIPPIVGRVDGSRRVLDAEPKISDIEVGSKMSARARAWSGSSSPSSSESRAPFFARGALGVWRR